MLFKFLKDPNRVFKQFKEKALQQPDEETPKEEEPQPPFCLTRQRSRAVPMRQSPLKKHIPKHLLLKMKPEINPDLMMV